jgi:hypothetical protein
LKTYNLMSNVQYQDEMLKPVFKAFNDVSDSEDVKPYVMLIKTIGHRTFNRLSMK